MHIRILCDADPDSGAASASVLIRIHAESKNHFQMNFYNINFEEINFIYLNKFSFCPFWGTFSAIFFLLDTRPDTGGLP